MRGPLSLQEMSVVATHRGRSCYKNSIHVTSRSAIAMIWNGRWKAGNRLLIGMAKGRDEMSSEPLTEPRR